MQSFNEISRVQGVVSLLSPKQSGKAFSCIYPLQSALSGSMFIILEQLNGLAVWAIIHSNTFFYLCWSIAKDIVRIETVYLCHRGRWIWPQGQHHNKSSSYSIAFFPETWQRQCPYGFHTWLCLFIFLSFWQFGVFIYLEIWWIQ